MTTVLKWPLHVHPVVQLVTINGVLIVYGPLIRAMLILDWENNSWPATMSISSSLSLSVLIKISKHFTFMITFQLNLTLTVILYMYENKLILAYYYYFSC